MNYKYTVYKDGKVYAHCNTIIEISKKLNISRHTIAKAIENGNTTHDKYRIERIKREERTIHDEWEEAVKPFRNVEWVKKGGRKIGASSRQGFKDLDK